MSKRSQRRRRRKRREFISLKDIKWMRRWFGKLSNCCEAKFNPEEKSCTDEKR